MNRRSPVLFSLPALVALAATVGCDRTPAPGNNGEGPVATPAPPGPAVCRLTPESAARHGITSQPASVRTLLRRLDLPARVALDQNHMAHIGSPLRGRVAAVLVQRGDRVAAGDPLLVIDSPELGEAQIALLERRSAVDVATPKAAFAAAELARGQALFHESQGIAEAELRRREAANAAAVAELRAAEVAATAAAQRLRLYGTTDEDLQRLGSDQAIDPRLVVRAPFDGRIVARDVTLGELVAPEVPSLLQVADTRVLWVLAAMPEARIGEVAVGAVAQVVDHRTGERIAGTVTSIAPMLDDPTRSLELRIEVVGDGAAQPLVPGMFVEAAVVVRGGEQEALAIEAEALQTVDGETVVFVPVAGETHAYALRVVDVGAEVDGLVPVRHGLAPGEPVVTRGSFVLKAQITRDALTGEDG